MTPSPKLTHADDKGLVRYNVTTAKPNDGREPWGTMEHAQYGRWYRADDADAKFAAIESRHAEECKRLTDVADDKQREVDRLTALLARQEGVRRFYATQDSTPSAYAMQDSSPSNEVKP